MVHGREPRRFSAEEYLILDERAATKSEFCDGEIFAMCGASLEHNRIVRNILTDLTNGLRGKSCEALPSDMRLHIEQFSVLAYPDILVICGPPRLMPGRKDTLMDATLLVEVLSPTTRDYDRNDKFRVYRGLPSFCEYLVVSQDEVRVELHRRQGPGEWLMTEITSFSGEVSLTSVDVRLPISSIYMGVFGVV